jgi:hypothetical protein
MNPKAIIARLRAWLGVDLGAEDVALVSLLALCYALCIGSGYGFDFTTVFKAYLRFFGGFLTTLFVTTRVVFALRLYWTPRHTATRWLHRQLGGPMGPRGEVIKNDLVLLLGILLLVGSLSFYSNLKSRIPAINDGVYDDDLIWLDAVLFGDGFAPWFEGLARDSVWWRSFLDGVYFHDYVWMVFLAVVFLARSQRQRLMWLVKSVCVTYIVAVLWTTAYPTYGPFFFDLASDGKRFAWMHGDTMAGNSQIFLMRSWATLQGAMHTNGTYTAVPFAGIAALPSLHIGHMVILAVVARRTLPLYSLFVVALTSLTFMATIAFGWHYGVDAIAGLALGVAIPEGIRALMLRRNPDAFTTHDRVPLDRDDESDVEHLDPSTKTSS